MKKIGIDARLISQTGVGVYIRNLLFFLPQFLPQDVTLYVYLMEQDFKNFALENKRILPKQANYQWHSISEQTRFLAQIYLDNLDLMHFTYFSYPILYYRPFISTVHDLTPILFKSGKATTRGSLIYGIKHLGARITFHQIVTNSAHIITPTEIVRRQIAKVYGDRYLTKMSSIHEGVDERIKKAKPNNALQKRYGSNFIIYIGNFYPHKNVDRLIEAYAGLNTDTRLILAGPDGLFAKRIKEVVKRHSATKKILIHHNPSEEDRVFLYKNARCLVHPSLAEGFGLTLLEAAYFNCPIVASDIPVFHEVLGHSYLDFNPLSISDIRGSLWNILTNRPTVDYTNMKGRYSFKTTAQETMLVYTNVLKKP